MSERRVAAVVLGGGSGSRVGAGMNKVLLPLRGLPVLAWSVRTALSLDDVDRIVVVLRDEERPEVRAVLDDPRISFADPGATRHGSEWRALQALAEDIDAGRLDVVAIHDGARPLAERDLWRGVVETAAEFGGAIPGRPLPGLARHDRAPLEGEFVGVQTPQAFRAGPLLSAYRRAEEEGFDGTDTAACLAEFTDLRIHAVPAPETNLKITFPEDVARAEELLDG